MPAFSLAAFASAFLAYLDAHVVVTALCVVVLVWALLVTAYGHVEAQRQDRADRERLKRIAIERARQQMLASIARARGRE